MSIQQFGHAPIAVPAVPEPSAKEDNGSALPRIQATGFSGSRAKFSMARSEFAPRAAPQRIMLGHRFKPLSRKYAAEHRAAHGTMLPHRLASRLSTDSIESMARRLLANGRVLAARKLVEGAPSAHVAASEALRRLRVVLAEPVVRRTLPARIKRSADIDWLRRHAHSYTGKWVAVADGRLLAADESLAALRLKLQELVPEIKPLLHRL